MKKLMLSSQQNGPSGIRIFIHEIHEHTFTITAYFLTFAVLILRGILEST